MGKPESLRGDEDPADIADQLAPMPNACALDAAKEPRSLEDIGRLTSWRIDKPEVDAALEALKVELSQLLDP